MKHVRHTLGAVTLAVLAVHCTPEGSKSESSSSVTIPTENPGVEFRGFGSSLSARFATAVAHANVRLADHADGAFEVTTQSDANFRVRVTTKGAGHATAQVDRGLVKYTGALGANTEIMHRVTPEGTEDYATFQTAPTHAALQYQLELGDHIAGLRQIGDSIEFLDAEGTPRLRMNTPYGVDAAGKTFAAHAAVEGCAVDTNPVAPWGRAVVAPAARNCTVNITWNGNVSYPATIDPAWTSTMSMSAANISYEMLMTKLTGGKVLVVNAGRATQLFDPATNTWANTGQPADANHRTRLISTDTDTAALITNGTYFGTYDLATGMWTTVNGGGTFDVDGATLYNVGGPEILVIEANTRTRIYNKTTAMWTNKVAAGTVASVGFNPALLPLGGNKFALQGANSATLRIYDLTANTWATNAAPVAGDANCNSLVLLTGGKILSYSQSGAASIMDLTAGTSAPITAPLSFTYVCARTASERASATTHFVWGGRFTFNEANNAFTDNGVFPSGAVMHGAITKLNDGRYLAAGGNAGQYYSSADLYGPSAQTDCDGLAATPVFNTTTKLCVACDGDNGGTTAAKCPTTTKPTCQLAGALAGQCTECNAASEALCTGTKPRCDVATGTCAACDGGFGAATGNRLCKTAAAPACLATGECMAANGDKGTTATAPCPTDANPMFKSDGSCGKCTANADCAGAGHAGTICNVTSGACGNTCATNADCTAAQYCDGTSKLCTAKKADGATCTTADECTAAACTAGKCGKPVVTPDAGTSSSSSGGSSSGGASSSGGSSSGAPSSSSGGSSSGSSGSTSGSVDGGGCSCNSAGSASNGFLFALAATLVLAANRRKRQD